MWYSACTEPEQRSKLPTRSPMANRIGEWPTHSFRFGEMPSAASAISLLCLWHAFDTAHIFFACGRWRTDGCNGWRTDSCNRQCRCGRTGQCRTHYRRRRAPISCITIAEVPTVGTVGTLRVLTHTARGVSSHTNQSITAGRHKFLPGNIGDSLVRDGCDRAHCALTSLAQLELATNPTPSTQSSCTRGPTHAVVTQCA